MSGKVEPPRKIDRNADPHARARHDGSPRAPWASIRDPQRPPHQVEPVVRTRESEGTRQVAGPARKSLGGERTTARAHEIDPALGIDRPQQHGPGNRAALRHHVEAEVHSVDEVDVGVSGRTEHDGVPRSLSAVAVTGRVLGAPIGLRLDDDPRDPSLRALEDEQAAEELARHRERVPAVEGASERLAQVPCDGARSATPLPETSGRARRGEVHGRAAARAPRHTQRGALLHVWGVARRRAGGSATLRATNQKYEVSRARSSGALSAHSIQFRVARFLKWDHAPISTTS